MSLLNSSCFGVTFGLGAASAQAVVCDGGKEGTASVGVVVCCDGDDKGGETSITFSTLDDSDGLLPEMKVKNTN